MGIRLVELSIGSNGTLQQGKSLEELFTRNIMGKTKMLVVVINERVADVNDEVIVRHTTNKPSIPVAYRQMTMLEIMHDKIID